MLATDERFTAPASDEEMATQYWEYAKGLLIRQGVSYQHADDATQDVFTRLIERGVRSMYKPDHTVEHQGIVKRCTFRAFLAGQVALYARGIREKNQGLAKREVFLFDQPSEGNTSWAEILAGPWMDDYPSLDDPEFTGRIRAWLALSPPAGPGEPSLLELFDELAAESRKPGRKELQRFRAALGQVPQGQAPEVSWEVGGITLSAAQVHQAIDILEFAKGIMVAQPLASARHPLAQAAGGWYHPFSKEELRAFPEIAVDSRTHRKPAGHVKTAVIHRLRRMLAEAGAGEMALSAPVQNTSGAVNSLPPVDPWEAANGSSTAPEAPDPDETPWDHIEAVLWELRASPEVVDMCREWAGQGGMVTA